MTPMAMRCLICVAVCVLAAAAIAPSPSAAQSAEDISALNQQVVELYQVGEVRGSYPRGPADILRGRASCSTMGRG